MSNIDKISNFFLGNARRNSHPTPPDDQKFVDKIKRPRVKSNDKQKILGFCEKCGSKVTVQTETMRISQRK